MPQHAVGELDRGAAGDGDRLDLAVQPCRTAKYTVPLATEIPSPMSRWGTSVLVTAPLAGLSVTSARRGHRDDAGLGGGRGA